DEMLEVGVDNLVIPSRLIHQVVHHTGFAKPTRRSQQDVSCSELCSYQIHEPCAAIEIFSTHRRSNSILNHMPSHYLYNSLVVQQVSCTTNSLYKSRKTELGVSEGAHSDIYRIFSTME